MRIAASAEKIVIGGNRNDFLRSRACQLQRMLASVDIGEPTKTRPRLRLSCTAGEGMKVLIRLSQKRFPVMLEIVPEVPKSVDWVARKARILRLPRSRDRTHELIMW